MVWNWQHKNWPDFIYKEADFKEYERLFFENAGRMQGSLQHMEEADKYLLRIDLMSHEAFKTSEIEGELLNRNSLQSSIRKQFGLQTDHRKIEPAEQGIAEMMVNLYQQYVNPLDNDMLFSWHQMITNGRLDLMDKGKYRTHEDPMQVVSGPLGRSKVHFEAPPSHQVPSEMAQFINWFNKTEKEQKLSALVRAAISHLYFESIHPFEDGNGRIGRALIIKSLSQSLGYPLLLGLSQIIQDEKKAYYDALERNNKGLEISEWITYFCETILKAQDYTQHLINFTIEKGKFYQRFSHQLNERQKKVVGRMFQEGIYGFEGGLSAKNYRTISSATSATTTRDLIKMVEIGA